MVRSSSGITHFKKWVNTDDVGGLVDSVNGMTGIVVLSHTDVGAAASNHNHNGVYQPVGDYVISSTLANYVTNSGLSTTLSNYATVASLADYAPLVSGKIPFKFSSSSSSN